LDLYAVCRGSPSIPFRRVAQYEIRLFVGVDGITMMQLQHRDSLSRIDGTSSISTAVLFASLRLIVLLIVAFVMYNRAEKVSSSAFSTLRAALDVANGTEKRGFHTQFEMAADALIGLFAIVSRALVIATQAAIFIDDGSQDAVVFESIGIVSSFVHFGLRNLALKVDLDKEAPLSKLGGSMSLPDASVAALLSVASTPLLGETAHFDGVARLFCAVLIALYTIHRMLFSVTASILMATTTASSPRYDNSYSAVLWVSAALWMLQSASVVFALGRFFCVAQSFSLTRTSVGPPNTTEMAVLLGSLALSIPYVNSVLLRAVKYQH
jgi:hypothetical protein